jgi:hypothetical protein
VRLERLRSCADLLHLDVKRLQLLISSEVAESLRQSQLQNQPNDIESVVIPAWSAMDQRCLAQACRCRFRVIF